MSKFKDWLAYKFAYSLALEIFQCSASFPKEETYSLTGQIRRSSRSVCAGLAEAYGKRMYPAHFKSKMSDVIAEINETQCWLDFAADLNYVSRQLYEHLSDINGQVGKLAGTMIRHPDKFTHNGN